MEFLQPSLLGGILAIAIPIAIHFWHQKKGTPLAWAATQWLVEKSHQSKRGLRLDQLLLLALRCLVLMVLALLLSEPFLRKNEPTPALQKIHLVQPDAFLVDNYRFELQEALQKGEPLYWLTPALPPLQSLVPPTGEEQVVSPVLLQNTMHQLARAETELHLYVINQRTLAQLPQIQTFPDFKLHTVPDTLRRPPRAYWLTGQGKKLYVDAGNRLRTRTADPDVALASRPSGEGPLRAGLDLPLAEEHTTVEAALRAFAEVYDLNLTVEDQKGKAAEYTLLVTNRVPVAPAPGTLYVVTGQSGESITPNVVYTADTLTPQTSSRVADGQLPEWLAQHLLDHFGISGDASPLTSTELRTLFRPVKPAPGADSAGLRPVLFGILLVLIILERCLALLKNA